MRVEVGMNSVLIIGHNKKDVFMLAEYVKGILNIEHVDIDEQFENILIEFAKLPLFDGDDMLQEKENLLIKKYSQKNNIIITMSLDTFLANEHYNNFKKFIKINVKCEKISQINQQIENFTNNLCDYSVNINNLNLEEIVNFIRGKNHG